LRTSNGCARDKHNENVPSIDGVCASYYILQQISRIDGFLTWLRDYHHIDEPKELLSGYKFLIDSIFKCLLYEIFSDASLGLSEDDVFDRAQFKGVSLLDTPKTCEKTVLLKRVWTHGRAVSKGDSWPAVQTAMIQAMKDLDILRRLFEDHAHTRGGLSKDFVLQSIACDQIFTFLNDTSHNTAKAQLVFPSIEHTTTEVYLYHAFPGYVYGLQYLWYSILGSEEFERTCVRQLHVVLNEKTREPPSSENAFTRMKELRQTDLDEEALDFIEGISRQMPPSSERWGTLDRFYRQIQDEIVDPREIKLEAGLGMSHLLILDGYSKAMLKELLDPDRVSEPEYLTRADHNARKKLIARALLWYDVSVLDTQGLLVFNGTPAFASTLLGMVEIKRAFHSEEPVRAAIFRHPAGPENQFDYSFGVFIPSYGDLGFTDNSGWIIFFDCDPNYSRFGFIDTVIRLGKKRGRIALQEITVEKEVFKEYLKEHSVSSVFDTLIKETPAGTKELGSLSAVLTELEVYVGHLKGKLLECVVHKLVEESLGFEKTTFDTVVNGEQIDCIGERGDSLLIFECKLNVHQNDVEDTIAQIKRKSKALSNRHRKVEAELVVYGMVPAHARVVFDKNGISVRDDFRAVIVRDVCFEGTRKETLGLLDWQLRTPGQFRADY